MEKVIGHNEPGKLVWKITGHCVASVDQLGHESTTIIKDFVFSYFLDNL